MNEPDTADALRLLGRVHATLALYEHSRPVHAWFYATCIALGIPPSIVENGDGEAFDDDRPRLALNYALENLLHAAKYSMPRVSTDLDVVQCWEDGLSSLTAAAMESLRSLPLKPIRNAPGGTT